MSRVRKERLSSDAGSRCGSGGTEDGLWQFCPSWDYLNGEQALTVA